MAHPQDWKPRYCTLEDYETEFADRHLLHGNLEKWARERPDTVAIIEAESGREFTYKQINAFATAIAIRLVEAGFRKGDFYASSLPLVAEHAFLEYACFKIGVMFAPLDLRLKGPEVLRSLGLIRAKGFAFLGNTPFADFRELGRLVQAECPYVEHLLQFSPPDETIPGAISAMALAMESLPLVQDPTQSPSYAEYMRQHDSIRETDGALVIYTTGSTGFPKPALLSHRNITCQNMCVTEAFGLSHVDRGLVNVPPSHVACQAAQIMMGFFNGRTGVWMRMFDPEKTLEFIQKYRIESLGQIPAMFALQWRLPNYDQYDLSSLRFVSYGGQGMPIPALERLQKMSPTIATGLGLTEMGGFVTYAPVGAPIEVLATTVGVDCPVTPLSVRSPMNPDGSAGPELPDGTIGEICFTGPQVFLGYVNDPEATRKTISTEGVCYTGDLGYRDAQGLHFTGRSKLVIKPKGYQVYPAQVEEHFAMLRTKISICGAVGAPHDVFSEGIMLFVEKHPGAELTHEELDDHAKGIAAYMRPSHYEILESGQFPLNRVAKTDYVTLRERAQKRIDELRALGRWDCE